MMVWITARARNVGAIYPVLSCRTKNTTASSSSSSLKEFHRFAMSSVSSSKGSSVTWPRTHTLLGTPERPPPLGSPHVFYTAGICCANSSDSVLLDEGMRFLGTSFLGISRIDLLGLTHTVGARAGNSNLPRSRTMTSRKRKTEGYRVRKPQTSRQTLFS